MPPPSKPSLPKVAEPRHSRSFDAYNSSSTGHQRAEGGNRLGASTGWRDSRNRKLMSQYVGGAGGGDVHVSDTVGAGARDYDPKIGALVTPEARVRARCSVLDMLANPGSMKSISSSSHSSSVYSSSSSSNLLASASSGSKLLRPLSSTMTVEERLTAKRKAEDEDEEHAKKKQQLRKEGSSKPIFDGVVVYVNGSTHPLISDHRLRHVLAEHGGAMSSHLGRRKVTHVILGKPSTSSSSANSSSSSSYGPGGGGGCGGGLAGAKLQREIAKVGGPGVKFVGVEWVLESIKAGKRLPEARFVDLKIAAKRQQSVYGLYHSKHADVEPDADADVKESTGVSTSATPASLTPTHAAAVVAAAASVATTSTTGHKTDGDGDGHTPRQQQVQDRDQGQGQDQGQWESDWDWSQPPPSGQRSQ